MLDNGADGLAAYTETTAHPVSHVGIEFYRLAWTMSDIASFTNMFRSAHAATGWLERKWRGFVALVEGASSMPCRRPKRQSSADGRPSCIGPLSSRVDARRWT